MNNYLLAFESEQEFKTFLKTKAETIIDNISSIKKDRITRYNVVIGIYSSLEFTESIKVATDFTLSFKIAFGSVVSGAHFYLKEEDFKKISDKEFMKQCLNEFCTNIDKITI